MRHDSFGEKVSSSVSAAHSERYDDTMPSAIAIGVDPALEAAAGLEVHDLAGDVRARDVEVVRALTGGEAALVQLAGLGVDEVRGEGAGVAAEEGVRQRHVAPEEADVVQAHEQHRERVDQAVGGVGPQHLREQRAVGERELQVRGDERRGERLARGIRPPGDHRDALDARGIEAVRGCRACRTRGAPSPRSSP